MILEERVLAIIPARGGSKGVPGKNLREVGGKPLIAWSIEAAKASRFVDRLVLSSDDENIIDVAKAHGCEVPFVRNNLLAQDETSTMEVVLDTIERCPGYDWILLLQPTSPLRTTEDIDRAIEHCLQHSAPACVSVCRVQKSPYWMFTLRADDQLQPLLPNVKLSRRQDLPKIYTLNGAIYLARTDWLKHNKSFISQGAVAFEMSEQSSIDLDSELDFQQLEFILNKK